MERLSENKLGEIYGGGVGTITLIVGGVVSLIIFISGIITGVTILKKQNLEPINL